jgi:hypothetical protein
MVDGDSGNNFLALANSQGAPAVDAAQLKQFSAGVQRMTEAAENGTLAVSEEFGQHLIDVIQRYLDEWFQNAQHFDHLKQAPALGTGPYAHQVGQHVTKVADGDEQSAKVNLQALEQVLQQAVDALTVAKQRYRDNEHGNVQALNKLHP